MLDISRYVLLFFNSSFVSRLLLSFPQEKKFTDKVLLVDQNRQV